MFFKLFDLLEKRRSRNTIVAIMLVLYGLIVLSTLSITPIAWEDEMQILSFGHQLIHGDRLNSFAMLSETSSAKLFTYFGAVLSELAFKVIPGGFGHRLLSTVGAILASIALYHLLKQISVSSALAVLAAGILLFDPVFAQGYRGGRVDSIAIFFAILSFILTIRSAGLVGNRRRIYIGLGGLFLMLSGLAWMSSALLIPLWLWCYVFFFERTNRSYGEIIKQVVLDLLIVMVGGGIALALLHVWNPGYAVESFADTLHYLGVRLSGHSFFSFETIRSIVLAWKYSLPLLIFGVLSLVYLAIHERKGRLLLVFFFVVIWASIETTIYVHRAVYWLPYLIIGFAIAMQSLTSLHPSFSRIITLSLLSYAIIVTVIVRSAIAISEADERSYELVEDAAEAFIGSSHARVYVDSWEFYPAARTLGWSPIRYWSDKPDNPFDAVDGQTVLSACEYAIFYVKDLTELHQQALRKMGFTAIGRTHNRGTRYPDVVFFRNTGRRPQ